MKRQIVWKIDDRTSIRLRKTRCGHLLFLPHPATVASSNLLPVLVFGQVVNLILYQKIHHLQVCTINVIQEVYSSSFVPFLHLLAPVLVEQVEPGEAFLTTGAFILMCSSSSRVVLIRAAADWLDQLHCIVSHMDRKFFEGPRFPMRRERSLQTNIP